MKPVLRLGQTHHRLTLGKPHVGRNVIAKDEIDAPVEQLLFGVQRIIAVPVVAHVDAVLLPDTRVLHDRH